MKMNLPPFIEIYRALIATPSISATEEALDQSNESLINLLAGWFSDLGFNVEVQPVPGTRHKFNLLASTGTGAGGLLLAVVVAVLKLLIGVLVIALFENSMARLRFVETSRITWAGFGFAFLAFVSLLVA